MSTAQQDSGLHILPIPSPDSGLPVDGPAWKSSPLGTAAGDLAGVQSCAADAGLWLNGDVLACACPECHGPMSIRLWLMLADCWICGTSVELTEEQERIARKLLEAREQQKPQPAVAKAPVVAPAPKTPPVAPAVAKRAAPAEARPVAPKKPAGPAPIAPPAAGRAPTPVAAPAPPRPTVPLPLRRSAYDWLRDLPAWLASFIFHVVAMILLGLLTLGDADRHKREILLTATMGKVGLEGGEKKPDENPEAVVIEDPGKEQAEEPKPTTPDQPSPVMPDEPVEQAAEEDVAPTLDDPNARELPRFEQVKTALRNATGNRMFEGRDPRVRTQVVLAEGGSKYTEAAVAQGLRWMSRHQADDGHWSLQHFDDHGDCNGRCDGQGHGTQNVGATGLALLPFLGAGQTHTRGIYQDTVARGARWLIAQQKSDGSLIRRRSATMYEHGIASIALCELYALTQDPELEKPAQKAVDFIVRAQHKDSADREGGTGGWRYQPGEPGDTSVVGWQLMALRSGRIGGLRVPSDTFKRAGRFLDHVQSGDYGGLYAYQIHRLPEPAMTAEGLLCRQYLGWPAHHRGLREGVQFLLTRHLPSVDEPNIYYWYYGTQVMHHLGGEPWEMWNNATREALVALQERQGHEMGSWDPVGDAIHGGIDVRVGGRLYWTALAICTLEVYYRHLPIYRGIEVAESE